MLVSALYVFVSTSRFKHDEYYSNTATHTLSSPTASTPDLIAHAHRALHTIWRSGYQYKRAGVIFVELVSRDHQQQALFEQIDAPEKKDRFIKAVDAINTKWGSNTAYFAAQGIKRTWTMQQSSKSNRFTTCWHEILTIRLNSLLHNQNYQA